MDSQQLELFREVAERGSFSGAALSLGIDQSSLSRRIRQLEDELGVQLFYRHGRGARLTDSGDQLLTHAYRILSGLSLAKQEVVESGSGARGELAIGLTPTVARILIQPLAHHLLSSFPNIRPRFVEGLSWNLLEWLRIGRLDFAVVYKTPVPGRPVEDRIVDEQLCLVGSPEELGARRTVPAVTLGRYPLLLPSAPHSLRRLVDAAGRQLNIKVSIAMEVDSLDSLLALTKARLGWTILPAAAIRGEIDSGELCAFPLEKPRITRTLVLVTPNNRPLSKAASAVTEFIKRELKQRAADSRVR